MSPAETERRVRCWAEAKALPLVQLEKWLALDESSRRRLVEVAEDLNLRTGQFVTALTLLEEIAIREGLTIAETLDHPLLSRVFNSRGSGPGRARAILDTLRVLRYPQLKRTIDRLAEQIREMKLPSSIKVVLPRNLSSDEVRIEITARGRADMEQVLACVAAKSSELMQLAASLSGTGDVELG